MKPAGSPGPAPGVPPGGPKSQIDGSVPGLAFSSTMRLTCPNGDERVPGGGSVLLAELLPAAQKVLQVAPEPGPHAADDVPRVIVTLAPCSPPLRATAGLILLEPPPRQKTVSPVTGASRPLVPTRTLPLARCTVIAPTADWPVKSS